jgi:hypothetical protein
MARINPGDLVYTKYGYGMVTDTTMDNDDLADYSKLSLIRMESTLEITQTENTQEGLDNDQIV